MSNFAVPSLHKIKAMDLGEWRDLVVAWAIALASEESEWIIRNQTARCRPIV